MGTAQEELASLKIRAQKGDGSRRITLVDHAEKTSRSGTVLEGVSLLAALVDGGKGERQIHVVDHQQEKARKLENPSGATRKVFNCRTPEQWKEFNAAVEPYFEEAVDPHIAIDLVIKALTAFTRATIRSWVQDQNTEPGAPATEPELPDFLRD